MTFCDQFARLENFLTTAPTDALLAFWTFWPLLLGTAWTFSIPRRKGFGLLEFWGPTRFFAWVQRKFIACKPKKAAYFLTEIVSGVFHMPAAYLLGFIASPFYEIGDAHAGRWMAAAFFMFWFGIGLGRGSVIDKLEKRAAKLALADDAVANFLKEPVPCFFDCEGKAPWSVDACRNIFVRSIGVTLAFVEDITIDKKERVAIIRHLGVVEGFERRKIGRRLALALRSELAWHCGVDRIEFAERSEKYESACYPEFFQSLGAAQQDTFQTRPGRGNWVWGG